MSNPDPSSPSPEVPEESTSTPDSPTPAPEETASSPDSPTPAPEEATSSPDSPTPAPEEAAPALDSPPSAPEETAPAPDSPASAPEFAAPIPLSPAEPPALGSGVPKKATPPPLSPPDSSAPASEAPQKATPPPLLPPDSSAPALQAPQKATPPPLLPPDSSAPALEAPPKATPPPLASPEPTAATPEPPKEIPSPPPVLPTPDLRDLRDAGPTYGVDNKPSAGKHGRGPAHPTDSYPPLKKQRSKKGCCACLGTLILLPLLIIFVSLLAIGFFGPGRYLSEGYQLVQYEENFVTITTAPEEPTIYLVKGTLMWKVPVTEVPVAILASTIEIEGDFHKDVSVTGLKVTCSPKARFAENLEVLALELHQSGMTLKGELQGKVMRRVP